MGKGIDALYISSINCFDWTQSSPEKLFNKLSDFKIKTYACDASFQSKQNALISVSTVDDKMLAKHFAQERAVLRGVYPPNDPLADVVIEGDPKVVVSLDVARKSYQKLPITLLITSDILLDNSLPNPKSLSEREASLSRGQ